MSLNSTVADISGNIITIFSAGDVNVIATQEETENFLSASVTTTLIVNRATPTITNFSIPKKIFGDPSFEIIDPSSNSPGSFSYVSSDESIATISGNTITIIGGGTCQITVTQESTFNYESTSITTNFSVRQAPPVITSLEHGPNNVLIYLEPDNSGLEILNYGYTLGLSIMDIIPLNVTQSPILITGLSPSRAYIATLYSFTSEGYSNMSNRITFRVGTPNAPIINSIDVSNNINESLLTINYTQSTITNGSDINRMFFYLDGRLTGASSSITSPLIIRNINVPSGQSINFQLASVNLNGFSPLSNPVSFIIYERPTRLTISSINLFLESTTSCYAIVNVRPTIVQEVPITTILYDINASGNFYDLSNNSFPVIIPNLPLNEFFSIRLKTINSLGLESPVSFSSFLVKYVLLPPNRPLITRVETSFNKMYVYFNKPAINGSEIITYKYSLNNEPYIDISSNNIPLLIPIENNIRYGVQVKAVNLIGDSEPSNPLTYTVIYNYLPPTAPTITTILNSNNSLIVYFTPSRARGSPITSYFYSLDSSSVLIDSGSVTSPLVINGLINGRNYFVSLYANSLQGMSSASNSLLGFPLLFSPGTPRIISITPSNNSCSVILREPPIENGSPLITYFYSLDNGNTSINANTTTSPILINGLVNGTTYSIIVKAENALGSSRWSLPIQVTPIYDVPSAPFIIGITPLTGRIKVYFNTSIPNGSPIKSYYYSFDNGVTLVNLNTLRSPVFISNLENYKLYTVKLYAENDVGFSVASNTIITSTF
jgi:hypothetical protein